MNILEYAMDVDKTIDEIKALCDKLQISYTNEESILSDEDIILLDNEIQNQVTEDEINEISEEEELDDRVEQMALEANIDMDSPMVKKEKVKSKVELKTDAKNKFLKDRKEMYKHKEKLMSNKQEKDEQVVLYQEGMSVASLADILAVNAVDLIKKLMGLGVMANINHPLTYDLAELLVVDYGKELKKEETADISNFENFEVIDKEEDLVSRPPVVTVMGHVDHGKTSLLDAIRKTNVTSGEAGGITQAIGAYQVRCNDRLITFIDTPGHEAFTQMRARGASVTDIVIIIVAADDGVMPQTIEAIDHAKAANVPILVAINKMDKPNANPDRVLTELVEHGLTPEAWGGDVIVSKISALTGEGIPELLENILLVADMKELKANPNRYATGTVLESRVDKHIGSVATVLVQNGTLRLGDPIVLGVSAGKIRTLKNDQGVDITEALPSMPVEITGVSELPSAGDKFMAFETEKEAKSIALSRLERTKQKASNQNGLSLDDLFSQMRQGMKEVNVILKADVNGSQEAVRQSLEKLNVEGVKIKMVRSSTGPVTESDVVLANASHALIIGFNVRANLKTSELAKEYGIEIRYYDIIYKVIEDMENALKGMLEPEYQENILGQVEVRQLFRFSKVGIIAGIHVLTGVIKQNSDVRIIRDGKVIYTSKLKSLQHEKDQVKELKKDMEGGLTVEGFQDFKENDVIEVFETVEVKR